MPTEEKYAGFLDHIQAYLGPIQDSEGPTAGGGNRGFALFFCVSGDGDLVTAVTNGLRFQNLTAIMPLELACTLKADQQAAARALAALTATLAIRMGVGPTFDQVVPAPEPLIPDTEIEGVMIVPHPYIEDGFESLVNAEGRTELQLLTVVPVTAAEIAYVEEHGPDALYEQWEEQETDLLDVTRASAV
ncbi:suppressor of fused domain protein [Actinacidiphila glaucinigra]|uniref:Suppressor of fused protein (SUFU) n=1 Tax=Actinacidiphila glaucinigra TaxID=235986 RepID=A0A239JAS3_9ACTN|nr:suppressor of fused domain protein [Actinacidiphila glaucinigra]SNT01734.1 Suppressor of fused protein (SUFU) [Actinacidiphila glaucinigra]